jgi:hypothetical protein
LEATRIGLLYTADLKPDTKICVDLRESAAKRSFGSKAVLVFFLEGKSLSNSSCFSLGSRVFPACRALKGRLFGSSFWCFDGALTFRDATFFDFGPAVDLVFACRAVEVRLSSFRLFS